jgi:serine/threonine protein kinase/formylglycine-generating enzyme required for sulfatase activity
MTIVNTSGVIALLGAEWTPPDEFDEFRIVRLLGSGAMGDVYLAHDLLLERLVAVKFVRVAGDAEARARILEEARAIARLQHPCVVAVYRVADLGGHPYLVSEYVQGRTLDRLDRPMPWRVVLDIALDLTRGLAAAHRRGVLHRDVKPANAILAEDGHAKLLDFGLATILDASSPEGLATAPAPAGGAPRPPAIDPAPTDAGPYLAGTPMYLAPEIWRGELASRRSDLYSLGILLYELLAGKAPHRDVGIALLGATVQERAAPPLADVTTGVEPELAAIVDRLVAREPGDRFASADEVLLALEECAAPSTNGRSPDINPFRGLAAFEATHAPLFFGRRREVRELVDRVRIDPFVVVGGDSGTGKSSLCRAGVLPSLTVKDGWSCVEVVPGRHPVHALAAALAPWTGGDEAVLADLLRESPDAVARAIRRHVLAERLPGEPAAEAGPPVPRRLLLFVDQLEELLTLADPADAAVVATAIAGLAVRSPSVRVLATARSDFLSRLAMLPGLGDEMARGLYFLRPLTGEHIREVIVRPAASKGVVFESEALVHTLISQTEDAPGGLPLLQFTLAELWDARDATAGMIRAVSLTALGGVTGALTRHADRLLAGLHASERDAARRILLRLVTVEGTRTRRSKAELIGDGPERDAELAALEVLVRGRVLVANNAEDAAYEIAHEALLTSWSTLQGWLQRDVVNQAIRERVEQAAASWERMGRVRDLLWGRRQLAETRGLDPSGLGTREAAFLAATEQAIRRRRVAGAALVAVVVIAAVGVGTALRTRARRELEALVDAQTTAATTAQASARQIAAQRDVMRSRALRLFDDHHWDEGEVAWTEVDTMREREEREYRSAAEYLDSVLLLDPQRRDLREQAADLAFERLVRAERDRRGDLAAELGSRLNTYGDNRHRAELGAEARVELTVAPGGTQISIERAGAPPQVVGRAPVSALALPTGSLVLVFEAPGRVAARLPILLARGETLAVDVALPAVDTAPAGMLYVPAGRFLFGSTDSTDARRQLFNTVPLHEVATPAYFIARHEVTFGEWIEFLDALPPGERSARTPRSSANVASSIALTELAPGRWRLTLATPTRTYRADTGERLHYERRSRLADQDWTRFPVSAVSFEDATAFAAWLDRTGRVPGARLCDEYEWERAARGADARTFPSGSSLASDDANIDVTYDRDPLAFGPDEVGSHPASRSPVGADDMAGNVWEWTRSIETPDAPALRGGSWYQTELTARSVNRETGEPTLRSPLLGLRLCATPR